MGSLLPLIVWCLSFLLLSLVHPNIAQSVMSRGSVDSVAKEVGPSATESREQKHAKIKWVEDELIIKFKSDIDEQTKQKVHGRLGATKKKQFPHLRLHHVKLKKGMTVEEAIKIYQQDPSVEYAEPDYLYSAEAVPNDASFSQLWGMQNTGQTGGTAGADIKAPEAWNITTGSRDVVVAVIDTGIDYNHQDLVANLWTNPGETTGNLVDDDGNGYPDDIHGIDTYNHFNWPFDDNGHGTHVAGTIGAAGNNGIGVAGVNWQVQILSCKFLNANGSGDTSGAVECLEYIRALKARGVNIVATNNSWGGGGYSQALYDAINAQRQEDILFIAAAGNNSADLSGYTHYPSSYALPNIVSVAATDFKDNKAIFSNYGRRGADISAPGSKIFSTLPAVNEWNIAGGYGSLSGTSMATPHVTGLAALIKAQNPGRDWRAIKNLLLAGGDNLNTLYERTVTGKRINAYGSLTCSNAPVFSALDLPASIVVGTPVTVSALSINCDQPVGPVVLRTSTGDVISLVDDGISPDLAAGDGIFTGTWTPRGEKAILLFSSPAGQDAVEYPALGIGGYTANATYNAPYTASLLPVDGYPPYTWSILAGSLPPGISLGQTTGQMSGTTVQPGIYPFTVQISDAYGAKFLKDLTMTAYPDGVSTSWQSLVETNGFIIIYYDYLVGKVVDLAVDSQGNSYVTRFGYRPRQDGGLGQEQAFILIKYDQAGAIQWINDKVYGIPEGVTVDRGGNVFIGGLSATWNGDSGSYEHYQIAKYSSQGELAWIRQGLATDVDDIATDRAGNIYLIANNTLIKYDAGGSLIWSQAVQGGYMPFIATDSAGNILVGASTAGDAADAVLIKYDGNGNILWSKFYDNGGRETVQEVAVDKNGNAYLTGWTVSTPAKAFLIKYDAAGTFQWIQSLASEFGTKGMGVAVDENFVYVTGGFRGSPYAANDSMVQKLDFSGNRIWSIALDNGSDERGDRLAIDPGGNIMVAGNGANWYAALTYKISDSTSFAVTSELLPGGASGTSYGSGPLQVKGGTGPYTWSIAPGTLPDGLNIDPSTGAITGSPLARYEGLVEVRVADSSGKSASRRLRLQIMGIDHTTIHPATSGVAYDQVLTGGGGTAPYTWGIAAGTLPDGITLESPADGVLHIKGQTTATGIHRITLRMQDSTGKTALKEIDLSVASPGCVSSPLRITRTPLLYFTAVQAAADAALEGEVLQLQSSDTYGNITVNRGIPLILKGGYTCYFDENAGSSTIHGSLVVSNGSIEVENIILAP